MTIDGKDRTTADLADTEQAGATPDVLRVPKVEPRDSVPAAIAAKRRHTMSRLGVVGIVLAVALGFLIYKAISSAVVYFKTAQEAVAARSSLGNSTFQIEGLVVKGSIEKTDGSVSSFQISSGSVKVGVENSAPQPALFQQNVPVVLVGHFVGGTNTFASQQILVKHSNSYIAAHPNRVRAPNGKVH
jgi:cytochrome c-type biogenesis protein CcmE